MTDPKSILSMEGAICPVPMSHQDQIVMGHGSGGRMTHDLVRQLFLPAFENPALAEGDDAGLVSVGMENDDALLAISTDSHVVWPLFFPGGDIGRLAVCGTVNDIAMKGAVPLYLTAGFILEEGLEVATLQRIIASMQEAAREAGIYIVAGDTKVVQRGKADGVYINTSGFGRLSKDFHIGGKYAQPGDQVILSGAIGDHGMAVLAARGELGFSGELRSDVAPLNHLVEDMLNVTKNIHVLRDPTRGGIATTLNEIAQQSRTGIRLYEDRLPVHPPVRAACELLGFDPIYVANEGKLLAFVPSKEADQVLQKMHRNVYGKEAVIIGEVLPEHPGRVLLRTTIGTTRLVDVLVGEILPRIC